MTSFSMTSDVTIWTDGWDARVDMSVDFIDQFVNAPWLRVVRAGGRDDWRLS
ncbi:hypothetical protein AB3662_09880 [Sorangium cellulosum]|uniref:hypothetical protein n=1 Tax=Sorangium cellulosum TaxID=56 RepID=UPI003D9A8AC5